MSQVVRSFLVATALLVHASPSFSEAAFAPMQLPKILVSTFNPENDPESGGIFAIRMWSGSRSKGLCNQDKRVLIVAVPEHFELDHEPGQAHLLSRMGAYLDETCGKDAKGFQLFASKLDIMNTEPDRIKDGLYAQYLGHRWANVINSAKDRQRSISE